MRWLRTPARTSDREVFIGRFVIVNLPADFRLQIFEAVIPALTMKYESWGPRKKEGNSQHSPVLRAKLFQHHIVFIPYLELPASIVKKESCPPWNGQDYLGPNRSTKIWRKRQGSGGGEGAARSSASAGGGSEENELGRIFKLLIFLKFLFPNSQ